MADKKYDIVSKINALPLDERYRYFLSEVTKSGKIYYAKDNEALWFKDRGGEIYPLWTAPEFAKAATANLLECPDLRPIAIAVDEFIDDFIKPPHNDLWAGVMARADGEACIIEWPALLEDLRQARHNTLGAMIELNGKHGREAQSFEDILRPAIRQNMKTSPKGKLPR